MIPNDALINALRGLDYHHKGQSDRMMIYKKRGDTKHVLVRRISLHDDDAARILLRQAGMSADDVEQFVATYRCVEH